MNSDQIDTIKVKNTENNKALQIKQNCFCLMLFSNDFNLSTKESKERRNIMQPI